MPEPGSLKLYMQEQDKASLLGVWCIKLISEKAKWQGMFLM